jgi:hypothetical protein
MEDTNPLVQTTYDGASFGSEDLAPDPLIPKGTFKGAIQNVLFNYDDNRVEFVLQLAENGGELHILDVDTGVFAPKENSSIDGQTVRKLAFLPTKKDETTESKMPGKTKAQVKLSMLGDFARGLGIKMDTPMEIEASISDKAWIGIPVDVEVTLEQSKKGAKRWFNGVNALVRRNA